MYKLNIIIALFLISGCGDQGNVIVRRGSLSYSANDIFNGTSGVKLALAAARGDVSDIDLQLKNGVSIDVVGKHGITPLWWAAFASNQNGFDALLTRGANPNVNVMSGDIPSVMHLLVDIESVSMLKSAINHGGNVNLIDGQSGNTLLIESILISSIENRSIFELLISSKANIDLQEVSGKTPMMIAVLASADYKLVLRLLYMGADFNIKDIHGDTLADIIHRISIDPDDDNRYEAREKVIKFLSDRGISVSKPVDERKRQINEPR